MSRRLIVIGAPLVLGLLELGHPALLPGERIVAVLAPIATWWTILHVAQVPLFALLGWAVVLLTRPLESRAARISRGAIAVFVVVYPAFDAAVGVASGVLLRAGAAQTAEQRDAIEPMLHALFWGPVTGMMAIVGSGAWVVALLAAAYAWRGGGAPWPVSGLLAASGLLLGFAHIRPFGPLACLALLIAAAWIEAAAQGWPHR